MGQVHLLFYSSEVVELRFKHSLVGSGACNLNIYTIQPPVSLTNLFLIGSLCFSSIDCQSFCFLFSEETFFK